MRRPTQGAIDCDVHVAVPSVGVLAPVSAVVSHPPSLTFAQASLREGFISPELRLAVMDRGKLVQAATPLELLAAPANGFVRDLVGRDDLGIKLLAMETVASRVRSGDAAPGEPIAAVASLRHALSRMVAERQDRLAVIDADGRPAGAVHLADLVRR